MDKKIKNIVYKYTDFTNLQSIGAGWIGTVKGYIPIGQWVSLSAGYQIALWAMNVHWISYWELIALCAVRFYIMQFINWIVGRFMIKTEIPQEQQQYNAKTQYLSPYEKQRRDTEISIANKIGAKHYYTDL